MNLGKSMEDYLEAILILEKKYGVVRSIDIARYLDFSKPSVSHAVKEMRGKDYLIMDESGELHLTEEGRRIADKVYEKHRFFTEQLVKAGVDEKLAEEDACKIEHAISEESFEKLRELLGGRQINTIEN